MEDNKNNEIRVFLSHSNKDYEKVRQVRNVLDVAGNKNGTTNRQGCSWAGSNSDV